MKSVSAQPMESSTNTEHGDTDGAVQTAETQQQLGGSGGMSTQEKHREKVEAIF